MKATPGDWICIAGLDQIHRVKKIGRWTITHCWRVATPDFVRAAVPSLRRCRDCVDRSKAVHS